VRSGYGVPGSGMMSQALSSCVTELCNDVTRFELVKGVSRSESVLSALLDWRPSYEPRLDSGMVRTGTVDGR
jgi:hypothetical protein